MSNIIPVRNDARLPATYEAAQRALAECQRIDECKDWADKAQALASYARQAKDETLRLTAIRIQERAIRRAGELLKQIEPASGIRTDLGRGPTRSSTIADQPGTRDNLGAAAARGSQRDEAGTASPTMTRTQAATDAGMSDRQRKTALRVANIPEPEFEAAIESATPPTVTQLAAMGTAKRPEPSMAPVAPPPDHAVARTALSLLRDLAAFSTHDAASIARAVHDPDFARGLVQTIDAWLDRFVTNLPADDAEHATC